MPPLDYATLDELKAYMPDSGLAGTTSYDLLLTELLKRASRAIDLFTKRAPGAYRVEVDATYYFDGSDCLLLEIGELAAVPTSVSVAESGDVDDSSGTGGTYTLWAASDYFLSPYNALSWGIPYDALIIDRLNGTKSTWYQYIKGVKIVGRFGFSTAAPDTIKEVTLKQAIRWFKRGQQAFQDQGGFRDLGQLKFANAIDAEIEYMLEYFRRLAL